MKRVFFASTGQVLCAWLVAACSSAPASAPVPRSTALRALTLSSGTLTPTFDPNVTDYSVTSLNSLYPIEVTATANDDSAALTVHGAAARSGVASQVKLTPNEDFAVTLRSPGVSTTTYTVHYLPPEFPAYTVTQSPGAGTEDVLLTAGNSYLLIADRSGAPLYYRSFAPMQVLNFQQHRLTNNQIVYSATVGTSSGASVQGADHMMDATFRDIGEVALLSHAGHDVLQADAHDFMLLDEDHYVTMSYVQRTANLAVYNPSWSSAAPVINAVVQEVDHGTVLFEWDSANVPSLYSDSVDGNAFTSGSTSDYLHLNSMDIDPVDSSFIFSLRHTNSIVKVDRMSAKILWTLGGAESDFDLSSDQVFSHQHDVRKEADGSFTVFDNGNNSHQTRTLSFVLDEANRKVVSFHVIYGKPTDQPQTTFMGSERPLGTDRNFIGWGGWMTNAIAPAATEIQNGAPVWQLTFSGAGVFSYRALPVDTSYRTQ